MKLTDLKKAIKPLIFLSLGLIVLFLIFRSQQSAYLEECTLKGIPLENCSLLQKLLEDFYSANLLWIGLVIILFFLSCLIRAVRWKMMLDTFDIDTKWYNSLGAILIAYITNLAFPRAGEIVRAGVIIRYEKISFDKAFGTIITDRVIDVICLGTALLLGFIFAFKDIAGYFNENLKIEEKLAKFTPDSPVLISVILLFVVNALFIHKYRGKIKANPLTKRIIILVKGLWDGMLSVKKLNQPGLFVFYTLAIWVIYFLMNYFMFKAFGPTENLGIKAALVVFLFGSLGILFPSPGGMGSYHFLVMESLAIYQISGSDGFSFAMIAFFTIQIIAIVISGLAAFVYMPLINKSNQNINEYTRIKP